MHSVIHMHVHVCTCSCYLQMCSWVHLSLMSQFPVRNGQRLEIEMTVYDAESRRFDNFTSLLWRWSSSDQKLLPTPQISSLSHQEGKGQWLSAHMRTSRVFSNLISLFPGSVASCGHKMMKGSISWQLHLIHVRTYLANVLTRCSSPWWGLVETWAREVLTKWSCQERKPFLFSWTSILEDIPPACCKDSAKPCTCSLVAFPLNSPPPPTPTPNFQNHTWHSRAKVKAVFGNWTWKWWISIFLVLVSWY